MFKSSVIDKCWRLVQSAVQAILTHRQTLPPMYAKYKQKTPSSQEDMQTISAYSSLHNMFHLYGFFLLCIRIYGFKWFWSKSSVLSHQRCLIPCVFFLGIWTWRGRFTSRQPLTATLADRSFLGKCPKSLSCKYSTSLSWSPPGCWTRLLFMDYNFQLQCNWLNTFLTEKQNKTTETTVREG